MNSKRWPSVFVPPNPGQDERSDDVFDALETINHRNSEIEVLYEQWRVANERWKLAEQAETDAQEALRRDPEIYRVRKTTRELWRCIRIADVGYGLRRDCSRERVGADSPFEDPLYWRDAYSKAPNPEFVRLASEVLVGEIPNGENLLSAIDIICDEYQREKDSIDAARARYRLDELAEEENAAHDTLSALHVAITATPAKTIRDCAIKAIAVREWQCPDLEQSLFDDLKRLGRLD